jgi:hypothetical protein
MRSKRDRIHQRQDKRPKTLFRRALVADAAPSVLPTAPNLSALTTHQLSPEQDAAWQQWTKLLADFNARLHRIEHRIALYGLRRGLKEAAEANTTK